MCVCVWRLDSFPPFSRGYVNKEDGVVGGLVRAELMDWARRQSFFLCRQCVRLLHVGAKAFWFLSSGRVENSLHDAGKQSLFK